MCRVNVLFPDKEGVNIPNLIAFIYFHFCPLYPMSARQRHGLLLITLILAHFVHKSVTLFYP